MSRIHQSPRLSQPVAAGTRRDDAYEQILSAIIFGELPPGSAVDEKRLALNFEIGLAGIRDALYRLTLEGLVERQPRVGTKISSLGVGELRDVFEARLIIECKCAAIAAHRADETDLADLSSHEATFLGFLKSRDFKALVRLDQGFHRAIARASKNAILERHLTMLHNNAARFWYMNAPRLTPAALKSSLEDHVKVVGAIKKRDARAAESAMRSVVGEFPAFVEAHKDDWLSRELKMHRP